MFCRRRNITISSQPKYPCQQSNPLTCSKYLNPPAIFGMASISRDSKDSVPISSKSAYREDMLRFKSMSIVLFGKAIEDHQGYVEQIWCASTDPRTDRGIKHKLCRFLRSGVNRTGPPAFREQVLQSVSDTYYISCLVRIVGSQYLQHRIGNES